MKFQWEAISGQVSAWSVHETFTPRKENSFCVGHFRQAEGLIYDSKSGLPRRGDCHLLLSSSLFRIGFPASLAFRSTGELGRKRKTGLSLLNLVHGAESPARAETGLGH